MLRKLVLLAAVLALLTLAPAVHAATLLRDYQFQQNLKDSTSLGPDLKDFGGVVGDGNYTFAAGQGLQLEDAGVTDQYSIEITFKFDDVAGWQRIIDFKNRTSDSGLYIFEGQLQFYLPPVVSIIGGVIQAGQEYRVRLDRDRSTSVVKGYVNDSPAFSFVDTNGDAIIQDANAFFFVDDEVVPGEESGGAVTRIRILDGPGQSDCSGTMQVSRTKADFGRLHVGGTRRKSVVITNLSRTQELRIQITDPAAPFHVILQHRQYTLAPGSALYFGVSYSPSATGKHGGELAITSSDCSHPETTVSLTGTGFRRRRGRR